MGATLLVSVCCYSDAAFRPEAPAHTRVPGPHATHRLAGHVAAAAAGVHREQQAGGGARVAAGLACGQAGCACQVIGQLLSAGAKLSLTDARGCRHSACRERRAQEAAHAGSQAAGRGGRR